MDGFELVPALSVAQATSDESAMGNLARADKETNISLELDDMELLRLFGHLNIQQAGESGMQPDPETAATGHLLTLLNWMSHLCLLKFDQSNLLDDLNICINYGTRALALATDNAPEKPDLLTLLGNSYLNRFRRLGVAGDLDQAIQFLERANTIMPDGDPFKHARHNHLGHAYTVMFERLDRLGDLYEAVRQFEKAVALTPDGHSDKPAHLSGLGNAYLKLFQRLGELNDLEKAVETLDQAATLTPNEPSRLYSLGNAYYFLFLRFNRLSDVRKAQDCFSHAVSLAADGHPDKPAYLNNLGNTYKALCQHLRSTDGIDKAIDCFHHALAITADNHPAKPTWLFNLGNTHRYRYSCLGGIDDLNQAFSCLDEAAKHTPEEHPDRPERLNDLGNVHVLRFERLGGLEDLNKAVCYYEPAAALTPCGHPDRPKRLDSLGTAHQELYERSGRTANLRKAVRCMTEAVALFPDGHPGKPASLNNLGNAHQLMFDRFDKSEDMQHAVSYKEQAIQLVVDDDPEKSVYLSNLGGAYRALFQRFGALEHLNKAVDCFNRAVVFTPDGHPKRPVSLNDLGNAFQSLFERSGELEHLDKALSYFNQSVTLTPDGHREKPGRLNNLGNVYYLLFGRLNNIGDLNKAVHYYDQAPKLIPADHPLRPGWLNNLGLARKSLFMRTGRLEDINEAAACLDEAITLTPNGHPDKAGYLSSLGSIYKRLYLHSGGPETLEKAIDCFEEAVKLTSNDHPNRAKWLNNLGNSYIWRSERLSGLDDLKKATSCFDLAVTLTPDGHSDKPTYLNDSGRGHRRLFLNSGLIIDAVIALESFKHAALMSSGHPYERLKASMNWARGSKGLGRSPLEAYTRALELMHQVVWLGIPVDHRYQRLATDLPNLVTEATAGAIAMQCYELALELLEQGRCVVWSQLLELRTPLDELHNRYPEMAKELKRVSHLLEGASMSDPSDQLSSQGTMPLLEVAQRHRQLTKEREQLIDSVRLLPGFDDFLRPQKFAGLISRVHDGILAVVNVHSEHCDALVVQAHTHNVTHIPLKEFSYQKAEKARKVLEDYLRGLGLVRGVHTSKKWTKKVINDVLALLWYDIVRPILGHLGINRVLPVDDLPHITWCITGPLSFLPVHAAGDYKSANTVLPNLAVSSYIPNLGALNRSQLSFAPFPGILAVGHRPAVRGLNPLPGTTAELDEVQSRFSGLRCTRLEEQDACADAVLHGMVDHSWVHIACHASQDPGNPLKSAFHLHDADLDLATIARTPMPNAQLAFLSACQTATGDSVLPDEAVHLAAGLLMAGYPTVIATSWSIHDSDAPIVARKFYEYMLEGGTPDSRKAATALHKAIGYLRERIGADEYGRWVPYIHIGH